LLYQSRQFPLDLSEYLFYNIAVAVSLLMIHKRQDMEKVTSQDGLTPTQHIDKFITELTDWRGKWIAQFRTLIRKTAPEVTEEWKWGVPVWSYKGNVVASGVFKDHVKLNFFKGADLSDPRHLFNAGLEAKATRAIDISEGQEINEAALRDLIRAAVAFNSSGGKKK
jgi:hypothetical protein